MRALITGVSGFVGSHLAEYLLRLGYDVYGTIRHRSNVHNIKHIKSDIHLIDCNILDGVSVRKAIGDSKPNEIYHLAAQSFVQSSWRSPEDTMSTNVLGTMHVLEAVRDINWQIRVMVAGSSEEYGKVEDNDIPISEETPLRPQSPYAVSKVAADLLAQQYYASYKLNVFISRAFNHEGPRRGKVFVTSAFARQIVEIEQGLRKSIKVGNLAAIRDFTDVRDIVKGYHALVNKGKPGIPYNFCTGTGVTMAELLDMFIKVSKSDHANLEYPHEIDSERMRPSDVPVLIGTAERAYNDFGWIPEIPLQSTVASILYYWRKNLDAE